MICLAYNYQLNLTTSIKSNVFYILEQPWKIFFFKYLFLQNGNLVKCPRHVWIKFSHHHDAFIWPTYKMSIELYSWTDYDTTIKLIWIAPFYIKLKSQNTLPHSVIWQWADENHIKLSILSMMTFSNTVNNIYELNAPLYQSIIC